MAIKGSLVLVIDDDYYLCNALRRILENNGYKVTTTSNGETALGLIRATEPDIVLLDLLTLGINGRRISWKVREFSSTTRVIYFTDKVDIIHRFGLQELRREADALITKPTSSRQILSKVSNVLKRAKWKSPVTVEI
jgi:two-component system response regulator VicR